MMAEEKKILTDEAIEESAAQDATVTAEAPAAEAEIEASTATVEDVPVAEAEVVLVAEASENEAADVAEPTEEVVSETVEAVAEEATEAENTEASASAVEEETGEAPVAEEANEETAEAPVAEESNEETTEAIEVADEEKELDITDKLKAARGNINRAGADARARRSESERNQKKSESEAKARLEETEKKLLEDEKRAQMIAEQKLAALDYAQNYRKKLMKDRQKAMSAAKLREKEEREAREAVAREAKAKEIAELLEKERSEARARGDRATELLNRVTKCAVVDENGNLRIIDKSEIAKNRIEEAQKTLNAIKEAQANTDAEEVSGVVAEEAVSEVAEGEPEVKEEAPAPVENKPIYTPVYVKDPEITKEEAAAEEVKQFLINEIIDTSDDKFVLNIEDDRMMVNLTAADDENIAPEGWNPTAERYAHEIAVAKAQHDYILTTLRKSTALAREELQNLIIEEGKLYNEQIEAIKANRTELAGVLASRRSEIAEVAAPVAVEKESTEEKVENTLEESTAQAPAEEDKDAKDKNTIVYDDPILVTALTLAREAKTKSEFKKHLKKAKRALKFYGKEIARLEELVASGSAGGTIEIPTTVSEIVMANGKILNIRCASLSASAKLGLTKYTRKLTDALYSEINRYNENTARYASATGEHLTRVSLFLPEYLAKRTGEAVIPAIGYRGRYIEVTSEKKAPAAQSYTFVFPNIAEIMNGAPMQAVPTVDADTKGTTVNTISRTTPVYSPVKADESLSTFKVENKKQYKKFSKLVAKNMKAMDKTEHRMEKASSSDALTAAQLLSIERERIHLASLKLIVAVKLGVEKLITEARRNLVNLFIRYNRYVDRASAACEIPLTRISSATTDKIIETRKLPDMPYVAYVVELFETVGEKTKVVGEHETKAPVNNCTFVFGNGAQYTPTRAAAIAPSAYPAAMAGALGATTLLAGGVANYASASAQNAETPVNSTLTEQKVYEQPVAHVDADEVAGAASRISTKDKKNYFGESDESYKLLCESLDEQKKQLREVQNAKAGMVVRCLSINKDIIDLLSDTLAFAVNVGAGSEIDKAKKRIKSATKSYNELVREYEKYTGQHLTEADSALAANIIAGNGYTPLPKLSYTEPRSYGAAGVIGVSETAPVTEYNASAHRAIRVMDKKELSELLRKNKNTVNELEAEIRRDVNAKNEAIGRDKVLGVIGCLGKQKRVIDTVIESLTAAVGVSASSEVASERKSLIEKIGAYNAFVSEYGSLTGDSLTPVSTSMADDIIAGRPYKTVPEITYELGDTSYTYEYSDPHTYDIKAENDMRISRAKRRFDVRKENTRTTEHAALKNRVVAQANKDFATVTALYDYDISMLESERDMNVLKYGKSEAHGRSRREITKLIGRLKEQHRVALDWEDMDNKRYYQVILDDPETVATKKKKVDRERLAGIRLQLMALLNDRDYINGKLLSIYTGGTVDLHGTSINQRWRRYKADAAERERYRLRGIEKQIARLPASPSEKKRLYDYMDRTIDAVSTAELARYRLKKDKEAPAHELRQLDRDAKENLAYANRLQREVKILIKKYQYRADHAMTGIDAFAASLGIVLFVLIAGVAVLSVVFGPQIADMIGNLFK